MGVGVARYQQDEVTLELKTRDFKEKLCSGALFRFLHKPIENTGRAVNIGTRIILLQDGMFFLGLA